ncbi:hypothetical protein ScPMuIL_014815 [Solemya velum]
MMFYMFFLFLAYVTALPERGLWTVNYDQDNTIHSFTKSMYNGTMISVKGMCETPDVKLTVGWVIRYSPCAEEFISVDDDSKRKSFYYLHPEMQQINNFDYEFVEVLKNEMITTCSDTGEFYLPNNTAVVSGKTVSSENISAASQVSTFAPTTSEPDEGRKKREAGEETPPNSLLSCDLKIDLNFSLQIDHHNFAKTWRDGYFIFVLSIQSADEKDYTANVTVRMIGPHGYISAVDWPLLIFYGVMGIVYILYGIMWLMMLACNWRDLLRVQYWIGAVIILGMLEKAVFYAEYQNIANFGQSVRGAVIVAELVSCLKRMLARMLVIIVSLGFGIVKPRLGPTLHKVLGVGALYFTFASIEGCMRALAPKGDQSTDLLLAAVPLAVTDASICWWISFDLVQTTRTLRLKRNIVKLSLYRHFTNTLIFAVLASIVYMIWSIVQHKMKTCLTDWKELWVDDAYWHLLFSILLLVIMLLWRPTANNQRYAFTPLLDSAEDDLEEESLMNDAFEGMNMRSKQSNGSPKQKDRNTLDDDLKWVEEHIPQSVTDKALPSLLDSDEEIMTAKYEMSKMQ